MLVTAGDNGQVCLWDLVRRRLIRAFRKHDGAVHSVCFTPDANWLVTGCTFGVLNLFSTIEIGDPCLDSEEASTVTACDSVDDAHDLGVVSCDISNAAESWRPDTVTSDKRYRLVTCGNDHCVKLWEITVPGRTKGSAGLGRSRDSKIRLKKILERHTSALTCVRFSANGRYIASCGLDKTTVLWETNTAKVLATISGHTRYVACCAFSRDGNLLATGSNDKSVMIWDLTGKLVKDSASESLGITSPLTPLEIDTKPKFEETFEGNSETRNIEVELIQTLRGHCGPVNAVSVSTNLTNCLVASGSGDKQIRIWSNLANGAGIDTLRGDVNDGDEANVFREEPFSPLEAHKYSVNHVEFSPCGKKLASCSLDGTTVIWNIENEGETRSTFVNSSYGVRVCRWSPDGTKIATAGDDERATLWSVNNLDLLCAFEKHSEAVNALAFTHDSCYLVSACTAGALKLFDAFHENVPSALLAYEEAHDLGAQACDFSPVPADGIIGGDTENIGDKLQRYLLATGGNDSLVKLWEIVVFDEGGGDGDDTKVADDASKSNVEYGLAVRCTLRNTLTGHGGNVTCVRFSPVHGEILGSVATDKTARIWSAFSAVCLHVLEEHGSLATACTFSEDTSLFVTGSLDRTVLVWKMPQHLVARTTLVYAIRQQKNRRLADWKICDTLEWLNEIGLQSLARTVRGKALTAQRLILFTPEELRTALELEPDDEKLRMLAQQLYWLKKARFVPAETMENEAVPHEFLCPVTHEVMREPVRCSDGFTYERAAITEWFLTSGKYTSPITNQALPDSALTPNVPLRNAIYAFLYGGDADPRNLMVEDDSSEK